MKINTEKLTVSTLLIVLVIGVVLISGCISGKDYEKPSATYLTKPTTELSQVEEPTVTEEKSVVEIICNTLNCDLSPSLTCTECYEDFYPLYDGIQNGGLSYCDTIPPDTWRNRACIHLLAMSERDESLCNKISSGYVGHVNFCITMVAIVKKDVFLCEKISYPKPVGDKDGCIFWVAVAKKDISLCNRITDPSFKELCIDEVTEAEKTR